MSQRENQRNLRFSPLLSGAFPRKGEGEHLVFVGWSVWFWRRGGRWGVTQPRRAAFTARTPDAPASPARSAPRAAAWVGLCWIADPRAPRSGCYVGSPAPFHVALVPLSSGIRRISAFRPEHPVLGMLRWQPSTVPCSPGPAVQRRPSYFSLSPRAQGARDNGKTGVTYPLPGTRSVRGALAPIGPQGPGAHTGQPPQALSPNQHPQ